MKIFIGSYAGILSLLAQLDPSNEYNLEGKPIITYAEASENKYGIKLDTAAGSLTINDPEPKGFTQIGHASDIKVKWPTTTALGQTAIFKSNGNTKPFHAVITDTPVDVCPAAHIAEAGYAILLIADKTVYVSKEASVHICNKDDPIPNHILEAALNAIGTDGPPRASTLCNAVRIRLNEHEKEKRREAIRLAKNKDQIGRAHV